MSSQPSPVVPKSGSMQPNASILIGAQWGDEGKGKWIDILAPQADIVCRFQGGNNAGHTLYVEGTKYVLHQLPSGVFHSAQKNAISAGTVLNPGALLEEIKTLPGECQITPERLWISSRCHVITPWQLFMDKKRESAAKNPIGTTLRGIGPTYADKAARSGLRAAEYVAAGGLETWLETQSSQNAEFKQHVQANPEQWKAFASHRDQIRPFVCDAETRLRKAAYASSKILLEGAQGTLLDINHGTYPFVTSSSTTAAGALAGIGLSYRAIKKVYGVAKAYTTRVGEGPFPTELKDSIGKTLARKGNEFGATTQRPRRCGWFDAVAMRYAAQVNGLDGIYLNKMDILTGFSELKIAIAYEHPTLGTLDEMPDSSEVLAEVKPVYKSFSGWTGDLPDKGTFANLPTEAKVFIEAIEAYSGVEVLGVGTGPGREDILYPAES